MGEHRKSAMTTLDRLTYEWVKEQAPTFGSVSGVIAYWLRRARIAGVSLRLLPAENQALDSNDSNAVKFPPRRVGSNRAPRQSGRLLRAATIRLAAADWAGGRLDPTANRAAGTTGLVRAFLISPFLAMRRIAGSVPAFRARSIAA